MSDNLDMTPHLTLTPEADAAAAAAPAAPEAPALTLDPAEAAGRQRGEAGRVHAHRGGAEDGGRVRPEDRRHRLQRGAPVRGRRPEEHRLLLGERPEQRAHQGFGRGGRGPVLPGGGAEGLWPGGGRGRHLRLFQEEAGQAGGHEGQLRQGGGQRGQDRPGPGARCTS